MSSDKKYYAIREVAELLHVSTSLIRFWEKKIPSLQPQKDKKGVRKYTSADIARLQKVHQLVKEQGYTLQGAKVAMKQPEGESSKRNQEIVQALKSLRSFLAGLKESLGTTA